MSAVFPAGSMGAALLLVRASVGAHLVLVALSLQMQGSAIRLGLLLLALSMVLGVWTRVAALLAALACTALFILNGEAGWPETALHVSNAVSAALAGPGAASVDAMLFGRRV